MCDLCRVFGHSRASCCKSPSVIVPTAVKGNAKDSVWRPVGNKGKEVAVDKNQCFPATKDLSPEGSQLQSHLEVDCGTEALTNPIEVSEHSKGDDPVLSLIVDLQQEMDSGECLALDMSSEKDIVAGRPLEAPAALICPAEVRPTLDLLCDRQEIIPDLEVGHEAFLETEVEEVADKGQRAKKHKKDKRRKGLHAGSSTQLP